MSKAKSDAPSLRMRVEGGRLVPDSAFDAERINSYRNGSVVMVKLSPPKDRVQIRRWFAILNLVKAQCKTPWRTVDEMHEAVKLALGIVNLSKTVSGQFMAYPRSLTELEDPELDEAVASMIELLSRITGVDVSTLKKEAANVGNEIEDEPNTDDAEPLPRQEEAEASVSPAQAPASSALRNHLMDFARKGFKTLSEPWDDGAKEEALDMMIGGYQGLIDTGDITKEDWAKFESIITAFKAVFAGKRTIEQGRGFAAEMIGCKTTEIGG